jgi:hypothetical protein
MGLVEGGMIHLERFNCSAIFVVGLKTFRRGAARLHYVNEPSFDLDVCTTRGIPK